VDALLAKALGFRLIIQVPLVALAVLVVLQGQATAIVLGALVALLLPLLFVGGAQVLTIENRTDTAAKFGMLGSAASSVGGAVVAVATAAAAPVWITRTVARELTHPLIVMTLPPSRRRAVLRPRLPIGYSRKFRRFALRSWVAGLLWTVVVSRTEVLGLQVFSTPEAVGLYALAAGLAGQVIAPVTAIVGPLVPATAALHAAEPDRFAEAFHRVFRIAGLAVGALAAAAIPVLVALVGPIYGNEFEGARPYVAALTAATCLSFLGFTAQPFLRARDRAGVVLAVTAAAAAVDIGLVVLTASRFGAAGAAGAYAATAIVLTVGILGYEAGAHGPRAAGLVRLLAPWAAGTGTGLATAATLFDQPWWVSAPTGLVLSAVAYLLVVRIARLGITAGDLRAITEAAPGPLARPLDFVGRLGVTGARPEP
jgi:O-antigen/teichoic acid export membrane protein